MKKSLLKPIIKILIILIIIVNFTVLIFLLLTPRLQLIGSKNITLEYSKKFEEPGYYSVNLFGNEVTTKVDVENNIDYNKLGSYNVNYSINNKLKIFNVSKSRYIQIVDTTPPTIELQGEDTILIIVGEKFEEPGYNAFDDFDGNLTSSVNITSNIDVSTPGSYEIIYSVEDKSSNLYTTKRNIIVEEYNVESVPIFTYHAILADSEKTKYASSDKYSMSISQFENQLKYLYDNGYNTISLDDFYLWYIGKKALDKKDVVITFDDGHLSNYIYAIPILEKYNQKATIFIITSRISDSDVEWNPQKNVYFSKSIIEDIQQNHKNIQLESHTHELHGKIDNTCAMVKKTEDEIYEDIIKSKEILNSEFLAYPFGCYTEATISALKRANYKMAFSFNNVSRASKSDNIYSIERININSSVTMKNFIKWLEV